MVLQDFSTCFSFFPVFGIVLSSIGVSMDYSLEILLHFVKRKSRKEVSLSGPRAKELKTSSAVLDKKKNTRAFVAGCLCNNG